MAGRLKMLLLKLFAEFRNVVGSLKNLMLLAFNPIRNGVKKLFLTIWKFPILALLLVFVAIGFVILLDSFGIEPPKVTDVLARIESGWMMVSALLKVLRGYLSSISFGTAFRWVKDYFNGNLFGQSEFALIVYAFTCVASHSTREIVSYLYSKRLALSARKAAITLMCIRKFRRQEMGRLGMLPKELVREIAQEVYDSRYDKLWVRTIVE